MVLRELLDALFKRPKELGFTMVVKEVNDVNEIIGELNSEDDAIELMDRRDELNILQFTVDYKNNKILVLAG